MVWPRPECGSHAYLFVPNFSWELGARRGWLVMQMRRPRKIDVEIPTADNAMTKRPSQIHEDQVFTCGSNEAECCVGEAASEACWEPCYCVLLQDEQTLTAYRSEDMALDKSTSPFRITSGAPLTVGITLESGRVRGRARNSSDLDNE
ncbi:hypothetical protein X777_14385 [Ooceraea biroi]|uniref:Uncharacterized protein n=1 Tax=Ooceraea biroi TaxID=2015173 RepID=A0A026WV21_OOCBI|nr:hypothetical protein X777_14385 [Ooceraea biroi]